VTHISVWRIVVALAVSIALTAAIATGAATAMTSAYGPHPTQAKFKKPTLHDGVLTIKGTNVGERIALRLRAGDPNTLQIDVRDDSTADFSVDRRKVTKIVVEAGGGNDAIRIDESNGAFTDTLPTTIDGGGGNDTIAGGKGSETLLGGRGNDAIDGNAGNDRADLGAGNDAFIWDPGDGSDTVEGQRGADTMVFNGANASETVEISANGSRLKFFRNPGNVTMDTAGIERVDFNALGGLDTVTVNDLSGTGVTSVNVDLAGTPGGVAGDGQADRVLVNATDDNDAIDVSGDAAAVKVSGLAATTRVLHSEVANDRLEINTLAGKDTVNSAALAPGAIRLLVDGVSAT